MSEAHEDPPASWPELAEAQDGVLSRRQALALGLTRAGWSWQLQTGRWQALLPGVVLTHSGPPTQQQLNWTAVLHAGAGAALSGDACLVAAGMTALDLSVLHVAVPAGRVVRPQRLHLPPGDDRTVRLAAHDVSRIAEWRHPARELPQLRVAPALLHAVSWAPTDRAAEWRVAAAVQQRLVLPQQLRSTLDEAPRMRRRALLRAVLDDVELGAHAASELDFLRFLRRHGLPRPDRLQRPVRQGSVRYLDAWWERQRVAVEVDGAQHREAAAWGADVLRANDLVVGARHDRVLLLRYTRGNLRHDGAHVARQLREALT